jgi:hypothetical protein
LNKLNNSDISSTEDDNTQDEDRTMIKRGDKQDKDEDDHNGSMNS